MTWDNTQAHSEGWGLFDAERSLQLQRLDEAEVFVGDEGAWRLVLQRASYGSAYHCGALDILRIHSNTEFQRVNNFRRTRGWW